MKLEKDDERENKPHQSELKHFTQPRNVKQFSSSSPSESAFQQLRCLSPGKISSVSQDSSSEDKNITVDSNPTNAVPKNAPTSSQIFGQKITQSEVTLLNDLPDVFDEAVSVFQVIKECIYGSKYMGSSGDHDTLDCDCSEQWRDGKNHACGEDSDCINRATKMECVDGDCNCGIKCQNTRFQRRKYANVSVIKTDKKGYGLRANTDLAPNDFIFEYIGEVINEPTFRRRTIQYDSEGIKHFYFMSLTKNEFIDATKKGNLGRFCNHSCNPNCYVDKWVVGEKLRMGVFAERYIQAGEELVFNYNVDRYGADPQPCYCDQPNCTGYIGGKTQTERATKLPHATIEALGIEDDDGWDTAVAKKPRKKKSGEDDEEYVNSVQPKGLDEEGVRKVMATLMQCKEKWIAVKLLTRLQRCDDEKVRNRVIQMHGYQILRTTLMTWRDDNNIILQVLNILYKFPRLTRNKINDSKIETAIETLVDSEHEDIAFESKRLLELWSKLEVAYRIPRKKFDPNASSLFERRDTDRSEETSKPATPTATVAQSVPRSLKLQRPGSFTTRPPVRRHFKALPSGWFTAMDENGNPYYYSKSGQTTWNKPKYPAPEPPPPPKAPLKSVQTAKALQDIIDSITNNDLSAGSHDRSKSLVDSKASKENKGSLEKWRSLPQEKQMKLYENTLFPHIKNVMQKFHHKLPKEDLKKFAKEVGKKLVASDFKNNRVEDPTKISERQEKKVKSYVRAYFEKAVAKKVENDRRKQEKIERASKAASNGKSGDKVKPISPGPKEEEEEEVIVDMSPSSPQETSPGTPVIKRKRDDNCATPNISLDNFKRLKEEVVDIVLTPPPPPPPPSEEMHFAYDENCMNVDENTAILEHESEEDIEFRLQEEDLMRENEEAERMEKEKNEIVPINLVIDETI
ncbi:histone-lysine N-methyltransferase [Blumeria hordei DH14]|uniref:Histone-lysine N-methyltransferase, H3 lysine-36 specific n=1 Tax=Blumeria graminis f. sp. hordei (strain DH14) TaxID=546991 RepID=N1J7S0_BLUG1|nr:histone-lysine N-methyltransferase [Blumeria hordei DH14]